MLIGAGTVTPDCTSGSVRLGDNDSDSVFRPSKLPIDNVYLFGHVVNNGSKCDFSSDIEVVLLSLGLSRRGVYTSIFCCI